MSYHLFLLPIIFLCCLHLPYVYREPLEPASIDRVLILDRPVRHTCDGGRPGLSAVEHFGSCNGLKSNIAKGPSPSFKYV